MLETEVHCHETADDIITLDPPPHLQAPAPAAQLQAPAPKSLSAASAAMLAAKLKPAEQAMFELEDLEQQREKWEGTELAASCQWSSNNPHLWHLNFPHPSHARSIRWSRNSNA